MKTIQQQMCDIMQGLDVRFILESKPISAAEVFSPTGLMPAIARRADQICTLCLGYGIGISFVEAETGLLGVKIIFDETSPSSLRFICITDVIMSIRQASPDSQAIDLDELMYD